MNVWIIIAITAFIWIMWVVILLKLFEAANRADREIEDWLPSAPRCDLTGEPLSARQRFDSECG